MSSFLSHTPLTPPPPPPPPLPPPPLLAADALIVLTSLLSVLLAVVAGGDPISAYFLAFPPAPGALFALCVAVFACAVVAASYACAVRSADQLASQLTMLVSTVAGGVFLKYVASPRNPTT